LVLASRAVKERKIANLTRDNNGRFKLSVSNVISNAVIESLLMKPSELPGARRLYRLTNHALAQIRELWQYAGEDELPPDSFLKAQVEAVRILRIDVPLSANRQFQLFCSEHFHGLADILDCLAADQLWALLSMRVQLANSNQLQAQSAAVRFGGLGRRYVLVAFNDRPVGLLSHADGSGLLPEARPKLTALSWEEIRLALMLDIGSN
jgi:hypothetical protein